MLEIEQWLLLHQETLPEPLRKIVEHYQVLLKALSANAGTMSSLIRELRKALGIIPSSEKRKNSGDPLGSMSRPDDGKPKSKKERLLLSRQQVEDRANWHKNQAKKHGKKAKEIGKKIMELEDIEPTPEEIAEEAAERQAFSMRLKSGMGNGPDPALEQPQQAFMEGSPIQIIQDQVVVEIDSKLLAGREIVSTLYDERTRYGFSLSLQQVNVKVEKAVIKDEECGTRIVSASTREIGPPRMNVTWDFLSNLSIMVSQYAMPFHRLGNMLSVPDRRFTSGGLARMYSYVAERFMPIYLHYFTQLAKAPIISGDDTSPRVLEVSRYFQ